MWPLFAQHFRPLHFAVTTINRERKKLVTVRHGHTVVNSRRVIIDGFLRRTDWRGGKDINRITGNDWRRMPFAWDSNFPTHVVGFAPVNWRIRAGCDAVG